MVHSRSGRERTTEGEREIQDDLYAFVLQLRLSIRGLEIREDRYAGPFIILTDRVREMRVRRKQTQDLVA